MNGHAISLVPLTHAQNTPTTTPPCQHQVKILVEVGGANIAATDRWDQTPLDEAQRVGAAPVVKFLQVCVRGGGGSRAARWVGTPAICQGADRPSATRQV